MTTSFSPALNEFYHLIECTGEDAITFLQGQLSCDLNSLQLSQSCFGALCNSKGRAITLLYVLRTDSGFYLLLPSDQSTLVLEHLQRFIFRSKIKMANVTDNFSLIGQNDAVVVNNTMKFQLSETLSVCIEEKNDKASNNADIENWRSQLIESVIPTVHEHAREGFIPQQLNMEKIDGISFKKGCYTGQEVIARLHYKGEVKKRTVGFTSAQPFTTAETLFVSDNPNSVGTVLDVINNKDGSTGLLVLHKNHLSQRSLSLNDGRTLTLNTPAYLEG